MASCTCLTLDAFGDCGPYHGWVVGVNINNRPRDGLGRRRHRAVVSGDMAVLPAMALTCLWSPETRFTNSREIHWRGGEAIVRFQAGPVFDPFWAPANWQSLDQQRHRSWRLQCHNHRRAWRNPFAAGASVGQRSEMPICLTATIWAVSVHRRLAAMNVSSVNFRGTSSAAYTTGEGTHFVFHTEAAKFGLT